MPRALDWDTLWRWELFRRRCDPLDFRRWKSDSARALRALFPATPGPRLLDATCGLGDHAIILAEQGFRVDACDASPVALEAAAQAIREAGAPVRLFPARWEQLGAHAEGRYDLIFHDALHWIEEPADLEAALRGLRAALRPGGALVYFFADAREPDPGAGLRLLAWDWEHMERSSIAWDLRADDTRVALAVANERGADFIDQHHAYLVFEGQFPPRIEALTVRRVYRWDWHALSATLARGGFRGMRSEHFTNVKGHRVAMNLALRED